MTLTINMLLHLLLCSCLVGLALTTGNYDTSQPTCRPEQETIIVTRTIVETVRDRVTVFDFHHGHHTLDVTSVILTPSTLVATDEMTSIIRPQVTTLTRYVAVTVYDTEYETSVATAVATRTSRLVVSAVDVMDLTITQTAVVPHTVTQIATDTSVVTATRTISVTTDIVNSIVTKTETQYVFVSVTSQVTLPVLNTRTVTTTTDRTVEATVTLTEHHYVTMCYEPKITYDH